MIYEDLLDHVLRTGHRRSDRTGTGTYGVFGGRLEYDLTQGFPLITSKRVPLRLVAEELYWFLSGSTNEWELRDKDVNIWREWADVETGELGPVYGKQWRNWQDYDATGFKELDSLINHDQIATVIQSLRDDPFSRRHLVSAWNVADLHRMALPPCHFAFQFYVREDDRGQRHLSINVFQRSADMFLGVPFNLASYALLTHMMAHHLGYAVDRLVWNGTDVHVYENHLDQARLLLDNHTQNPRPLPQLHLTGDVFDAQYYPTPDQFDIHLSNYNPHRTITAPVAV